MRQLVVAVAMTVGLVAFAMSNFHEVELDCIVGDPVRLPMIFLLLISFIAGAVTLSFYQLVKRATEQKIREVLGRKTDDEEPG